MVHIQLRRGSAIPTGEKHLVGEPMWDVEASRLGVYNGRSPTAMEWYPCVIGDKLVLNPSQTFGGKLANGAENNIYLDFSTQNAVLVKHRPTGDVLATLSTAGASFNSLTADAAPLPGLTNLLLNGNLAVKRGAFPFTLADTNTVSGRSTLVAPNWHLWKTQDTAGRIVLTYDEAPGALDFAPGANVFQLNVSNAPNSSGLRTFLHGYSVISGQLAMFSYYYFAALGQTAFMRGFNSDGTTLFSEQITGTGVWERATVAFTAPESATAKWAAFDVLYNPSGTVSSQQIWKATAAQLQLGGSVSAFENRPEAIERGLCDSIYREGLVYLPDGAASAAIPINNFQYGRGIVAEEVAGNPVTISDLGAYGFTARVPALTEPSTVKYMAYMMPRTEETV